MKYRQDLSPRLINFSIRIIKLASEFPKTPAGFAIASQIVRSATSIGANCEEAQDAISQREFLRSMTISLKEARETGYWLRVVEGSNLVSKSRIEAEIIECNQIISILIATVKSLKKKLN